MEVIALTRIVACPVCLLKTLVLGSEMFIEPVKVWDMVTGTLRWEIMIFLWLLSVNLVVPLVVACSVWFISVLHAPWKLCDSAAAMLVSIFLMLAAVVMWGSQPWRGVFMSLTYLPKESKQWNVREGECNLWGALCSSSGLPSVLQRRLLFSHFSLGFGLSS